MRQNAFPAAYRGKRVRRTEYRLRSRSHPGFNPRGEVTIVTAKKPPPGVVRTNSQRSLYRATYVPTRFKSTQEDPATATGRVMAKVAFIRGLNLRPAELARLQPIPVIGRGRTPPAPASPRAASLSPDLLAVVQSVTRNLSPHLMNTDGAVLRGGVGNGLADIGRAVVEIRQENLALIDQLLHAIRAAFAADRGLPEYVVAMEDALAWAYETGQADLLKLLAVLQESTPTQVLSGLSDARKLLARIGELLKEASTTQTLIDDFLLSFTFEPVGRIHLERMEMVPVGIEHGELVYSVPLTPKETVNIAHREWSQTEQTFENIVQDSFEGYSELGVAEKTDIATSTSNETRHSSSFDANGSVNFSYNGGPYSLTTSAAVDYGTKSDDEMSAKDSRAHSLAITRTAASRTRKDHKQSFRVASVAGTEDMAVRVLTNPSDTNAMRVDYFRLMRKWQVDLIRYGLRMTYDLVIPNPGNALASKVLEIQAIDRVLNSDYVFSLNLAEIKPDNYQSLAQQYGAAIDPPPSAPGDVSQTADLQKTDNQVAFGNMQFNVPDEYEVSWARIWARYTFHSDDNAKKLWFGVKDGAYKPEQPQDALQTTGEYDSENDTVDPTRLFSKSLAGRSGQIIVNYSWYHIDAGEVTVQIKLKPKQTTVDAWQMKTWAALKQAGEDAYTAQISALRDRRAQLEKDIESYDSLTLRRMEREEIMRLVLVWLFGPSFQIVPALFDVLALTESAAPTSDPLPELALNPALMSLAEWNTVRKYGEFIKYLQNAIEWENVLFFSYPYWWDLIENWPFKRFLVHPDFDHRTFLRAGCARVVVTIRPGFECSFAQLVEHFTMQTTPDPNATDACSEALGPDHPYVTIGDEIRNYAMTNYEHVPPANPDQNVRPLLYPLQQRAWKDMQEIMAALKKYDDDQHAADPNLDPDTHVYPATLSALPNAGSLQLKDPWHRDYVYKSPGDYGDYDLATYGADGDPKTNGPELDANITSWAEGNVIGRWYEYTPTGALDVAINMTLPTEPGPA